MLLRRLTHGLPPENVAATIHHLQSLVSRQGVGGKIAVNPTRSNLPACSRYSDSVSTAPGPPAQFSSRTLHKPRLEDLNGPTKGGWGARPIHIILAGARPKVGFGAVGAVKVNDWEILKMKVRAIGRSEVRCAVRAPLLAKSARNGAPFLFQWNVRWIGGRCEPTAWPAGDIPPYINAYRNPSALPT